MVEHERLPVAKPVRAIRAGMQRLVWVACLWVLLIVALQLYAWQHMLRPLELLQLLVQLCQSHAAGALVFIGAAALSPLLLIPAALLGSVAGMSFGPVFGVIYTIIGCNLSASLAYGIGRLSPHGHGRVAQLIERYGPRVRQNSFVGVIILRLSFLPYDPVNYLVGLMRVPWLTFIVANTLGSLPGVIAIVLAGTAIEGLDRGLPMVNPVVLFGAMLALLLSLAIAAMLRRWMHHAAYNSEQNH